MALALQTKRHQDEAFNHEQDSTYDYFAFAEPGSNVANAVWRVFRLTIAIPQRKQYADGNANYDNVGSGLSSLSYS